MIRSDETCSADIHAPLRALRPRRIWLLFAGDSGDLLGFYVGYGVGRLASLVVLPVLSRILGIGGFGSFEATNAALVGGAIMLDAGLGTAIIRYLQDGHPAGELLGSAIGVQLGASAVAALVISPLVVVAAPAGSSTPLLVGAAVVFCFVEGLAVLALGLLRGERRTTLFLNLSLVRVGVTCAATTLGAVIGGVAGGILGFAFGGIGFAIYGAARVIENKLPSRVDTRRMLMRYGLPLMATSLMSWALNLSDRLFLRATVASTALAEYAANYRLANLTLVFLVGPLALAWLPAAQRFAKRGPAVLRLATTRWTLLFSCVSLSSVALLLAVGKLVVPFVFGSGFVMNPFVLSAVGLSSWFAGLYFLLATPIVVSDDTRPIAWVALSIVAFNLGANTALIPPFGIRGAAVATAASYFALCVLVDIVGRRRSPAGTPRRKLLLAMLIAAIAGTAASAAAAPVAGAVAVVYLAAAAFIVSGRRLVA